MEKLKLVLLVILLVILVLIHGSANKLKTARKIALSGAVSGNANFDGSGDIDITTSQNNIHILTGQVTLNNGNGNVTIAYPSGLSKSNCIPIVAGLAIINDTVYSYISSQGIHLFEVRIADNGIVLTANGIDGVGSSKTVNYKVVLMEI